MNWFRLNNTYVKGFAQSVPGYAPLKYRCLHTAGALAITAPRKSAVNLQLASRLSAVNHTAATNANFSVGARRAQSSQAAETSSSISRSATTAVPGTQQQSAKRRREAFSVPPPLPQHTTMSIHLKAFHPYYLNNFVTRANAAVKELGLRFESCVYLPKKRELWTVLKSPHVDKKVSHVASPSAGAVGYWTCFVCRHANNSNV